jgi:hypothetical protein
MRLIISVAGLCFLLSVPLYGQGNCGCSDYVKIALGTTWYTNSTSQQRDYLNLLHAFETDVQTLNTFLSNNTSLDVTGLFGGSNQLSEGDYQQNFHQYEQNIETKIHEVYQTSTLTQYPVQLISGLDACHRNCSNTPNITCTALSSDPDTALFIVQYWRPGGVNVVPPKYTGEVVVPSDVLAVPRDSNNVRGTDVAVGAKQFRFDRSKASQQFTISADISNNPGPTCQATVPAKESQAAIPQFNPSCQFNVGFASQSPGYTKTYTCYNLKPSSKFLAVFSGNGIVSGSDPDIFKVKNWLGLDLTSNPTADANAITSPSSSYTNQVQFVLCNSIAGTVPQTGTVSVTVELNHCQINAGTPPETCSTVGNAGLIVTTY